MNIVYWLIFGLITSLVTIKFAPRSSSVLGTILVGITGAILGGILGSVLFEGTDGILVQVGSLGIALVGTFSLLLVERILVNH